MGSLMTPINLTLSDLERSKSRSFRYCMIEERYSVNIYFLVVFEIDLDVTLCSLLAGGFFRCPSNLSSCDALSVCMCVSVNKIFPKLFLANQLNFLWGPSLSPRDEVVRI